MTYSESFVTSASGHGDGLAPFCAIDHVAGAMQQVKTIEAGPDFRHVDVWIFDLDNTLYPAKSGVFAQIEARITLFVQRLLGLGFDEARRVQKSYYRDHGTTMNGLMRRHAVDPEDYLAFVHDIDLSAIPGDAALGDALARLPGRRFVFTNGCRHHARRVLDRLALCDRFDDVLDIRTTEFRPKPDPDSYRTVLAHIAASPAQSALFDDIPRNLVPAHALGFTTVWLKNESLWSKQGPNTPQVSPGQIDYETEDLCSFLGQVRV
ncbi:MAG TPA: pyrimidine 5'-nucleotidase [Rhizomicrobium sp.]